MHGLGGWFVAQLAAGISMTNSPFSPERIHRRQIYFPIDRAVQVTEGDLVRIRMTVRPTDSVVNWNVDVLDGELRREERLLPAFHLEGDAAFLGGPYADSARVQAEAHPARRGAADRGESLRWGPDSYRNRGRSLPPCIRTSSAPGRRRRFSWRKWSPDTANELDPRLSHLRSGTSQQHPSTGTCASEGFRRGVPV